MTQTWEKVIFAVIPKNANGKVIEQYYIFFFGNFSPSQELLNWYDVHDQNPTMVMNIVYIFPFRFSLFIKPLLTYNSVPFNIFSTLRRVADSFVSSIKFRLGDFLCASFLLNPSRPHSLLYLPSSQITQQHLVSPISSVQASCSVMSDSL